MSYKIKIYGFDDKYTEAEHPTMLAALKEERVFQVQKHDTGFTLEECCDGNFAVTVTPDQLRALAAELIELANNPVSESAQPTSL